MKYMSFFVDQIAPIFFSLALILHIFGKLTKSNKTSKK